MPNSFEMKLDSGRAMETASEWVETKSEAASSHLTNMGYAIAGMTRKLNFEKFGPRGAIFPSVRKDGSEVRLQIKWVRANRGFRKIVARHIGQAKRHIWSRWT